MNPARLCQLLHSPHLIFDRALFHERFNLVASVSAIRYYEEEETFLVWGKNSMGRTYDSIASCLHRDKMLTGYLFRSFQTTRFWDLDMLLLFNHHKRPSF
jgi:hypothetical protein